MITTPSPFSTRINFFYHPSAVFNYLYIVYINDKEKTRLEFKWNFQSKFIKKNKIVIDSWCNYMKHFKREFRIQEGLLCSHVNLPRFLITVFYPFQILLDKIQEKESRNVIGIYRIYFIVPRRVFLTEYSFRYNLCCHSDIKIKGVILIDGWLMIHSKYKSS